MLPKIVPAVMILVCPTLSYEESIYHAIEWS